LTGPIVFHSACSRFISEALVSHSLESLSASAFAQSASFFARLLGPDRLPLGEIGVAAGEEADRRRRGSAPRSLSPGRG
jgi:hypothetical protein